MNKLKRLSQYGAVRTNGGNVDHNHPAYIARRAASGADAFNGAYYYSCEIVRNIIPHVKTDRSWITINVPGEGRDHSICFVHNNLRPEFYEWLSAYKDVILVCGIPETVERVGHIHKAVYLPLSIDVEEVRSYARPKTRETAFVGRKAKRDGVMLPEGTDYIEGLPRAELLSEMAKYREVYAVGRTAIEALALGCRILPYDARFPDPARWKILDNRDAAAMLQKILDKIDGPQPDEAEMLRSEIRRLTALNDELLEKLTEARRKYSLLRTGGSE